MYATGAASWTAQSIPGPSPTRGFPKISGSFTRSWTAVNPRRHLLLRRGSDNATGVYWTATAATYLTTQASAGSVGFDRLDRLLFSLGGPKPASFSAARPAGILNPNTANIHPLRPESLSARLRLESPVTGHSVCGACDRRGK